MKILALKETAAHEKRVSLTPEIVKKLCEIGHEVYVEKGAGTAAGIPDSDYSAVGATLVDQPENVLPQVDVVTCVGVPEKAHLEKCKKGASLLGILKPHQNKDLLNFLANREVNSLSLELIPRISRAQSMDVLSSQSNLSGYKAVLDAISEFGRAVPLMMTAAGTIPPAKVLIIGAGVAGLQAIATAKRLGAMVSAFDVRPAAKEQVESLGATFVKVPSDESGEGAGGYAKEMSEAYQKRQNEKLCEVIQQQDIVITTASIPGKASPVLITAEMVKSMKSGSVIVDLAIENGGNCALTQLGKVITKHNVKIIGHANMPSRLPFDASQLYARNIFNLLKIMTSKENLELDLDLNDEIIRGACLTHRGQIVHSAFGGSSSHPTHEATA